MSDDQTTEVVDQPTEEGIAPQQDPSLSLEELATLLQIVDLAVSRGAFRGNEVSKVGAVFDKLNNFLGAVQAAQQAEINEEPASEENVEDQEAPTEGE